MPRKVRLLNVEIDDVTMDELVETFREGMLLTVHVDMIMKLQQDREFWQILPQFDVVTDLLLGMGLHHLYAAFAAHVRRRYGAEAGFITMNVPRLLDALEAAGVEDPIVCANVNKIGFRMCGGTARYEEVIATRRFRPIAMSVFASGAIPPAEALEYVCAQPRIESIVFGASSRGNILQPRDLIRGLDARLAGAPA